MIRETTTFGCPAAACVVALWLAAPAGGETIESVRPDVARPDATHVEWLPVPTLGGKQFWADELFFQGWRIQKNVITGHYRLVDPHNRRHGWGTFAQCRNQLAEIRRQRDLPPMHGTAVIVLHGMIRSRSSMNCLCGALRDQGGFTVINITYASTRRSVEEHAQSLARVVENLEGIERIHFVGHSLGNIVIRRYLHDQIDPATGEARDPRFGRMVMLGPPNHGSPIAEVLADNVAFRLVTSTPGQELGVDWPAIEAELATPPFAFGIIAGGRGDGWGFNPLLPGDDDGAVAVESARLAGAADFALLPVLHSLLVLDRAAIERTIRFLQHGYFVSPEDRRPIP
ncbi:MAG: lipase [Pirellulales bacterium]|nr:lipase [Pirellulales bacterium]